MSLGGESAEVGSGSTAPAHPGRVIFMCGPAGSGKSTVARRLEREGLVRLSFDEEAWSRGIRTMPLPDRTRQDIEAHLRRRLTDLVAQGTDVVLDFSFWSRAMREDYRALLRPLGVEPETIYLATDRGTCLSRVRARGVDHADDFRLSEDVAAAYFDHFEVPVPAEGPLTVLHGDDHTLTIDK
ncbi:AAA family ATPase [Ornithinimicrobium cavernae]|uniref:AAA family ATPase n=1 Tax=Ornithinimicrobium cavernae TaxID=2666047 RepID=UPI001F1D6CDB|nr:ATP-binding protein [Ornithinimicrobium cavernae]